MRSRETEAVFRQRVAAVRKARGLTQESLASAVRSAGCGASFTRGALAKVETGERHVSLGEAFTLALCLEVPLDDLCRGDAVSINV